MYILISAFALSKYSKGPSNAAAFASPGVWRSHIHSFIFTRRDVPMQKNGWQFSSLKGGESLLAKPSLVPVGCRDILEMNPYHHSVLQNCFNYDETMFKLI